MKKFLFSLYTFLLTLIFTLCSVAVLGQTTTLVNYKFDNQNLTPESGAIGSPNLVLSNVNNFTYPSGSGGTGTYSVATQSNSNYLELTISTLGYSNLQISWNRMKSSSGTGNWVITGDFGSGFGSAIATDPVTTSWNSSGTIALSSNFSDKSSIKLRITLNITNTPNVRLDDLLLTGVSSCAAPSFALQATPVDNITMTGASLYGNVTSAGDAGRSVTSRGFVYSVNNDLSSAVSVTNGSGTGLYNVNTSTLVANTLYYYRAFAVNDCATPRTGYSHTSSYPTFTSISKAPTSNAADNMTSSGFRANWAAPTSQGTAAFTYHLQVSAVNDFSTTLFNDETLTGTSNVQTGLSSSTQYFCKFQ